MRKGDWQRRSGGAEEEMNLYKLVIMNWRNETLRTLCQKARVLGQDKLGTRQSWLKWASKCIGEAVEVAESGAIGAELK